ncbi:hypothetical protein TSH7_25130 [Azospirillum sp. TSH7]|uniref:hypothetical protein n=1 Tax=unclassified Azospirillum TaxID=2630922 RepID=UPI000D609776|nr:MULTISPECIES: hypothetical protein [unclassified Azospirillum]PWC57830.1 hypothetical protein TSH7_25130 [Azospirillum sp. TSH7]PWC70249.1 hypothetical protein TSH20_07170 [Azospirillum sp. TSH20]
MTTETTTTTIPAGWKLVPIEPTHEMMQAAHKPVGNALYDNPFMDTSKGWGERGAEVYRAMLCAAPSPAPAAPSAAQTSRLQRAVNDPAGWCPKCGCGHDGARLAHLEACPAQPAQGGSVSELVQAATALRTMVKVTRCPVFPEELEQVAVVERFDAALSAARASAPEVVEVVEKVRHAISDLHYAYDMRQHAGAAASIALGKIEEALGMPWVQGAEKDRRSAGEAANG